MKLHHELKTIMLKSSLYDYRDAYILVKLALIIPADTVATETDRSNKHVIFKNCALFTDCICEANKTELDNEKALIY